MRLATVLGGFFPLHALLVFLALAVSGLPAAAQDAGAETGGEAAEAGLPPEVLSPAIDANEFDLRLVPMTEEELAALADAWLAIVKAKTEAVMNAQIAIDGSEGVAAQTARGQLTELTSERNDLFDKYSAVISAWEKKGGDEAAIAKFRAYRSTIIVEETRSADVRTLVAQSIAWATDRDGGIELLIDISIIIASLIGLLFVARFARRVARRWVGHIPNLSKLLQAFLVTMMYWIVLAIGLMIVLSALGIDISPVFALIGGASFIIAFAFQDTLGNLANGLMIMINRPFDEGDFVDVGGVAGTVQAVSIVATTVVTPDNQVIVIPNKNVWGNVITNVTASETRRVDLVFGIAYDDSIPDAIRVMDETVRAHPLILADPEPVIRVHELADSSVNFICRPWTRTVDYWTVYWDLTRQVKENFDNAGLSIPFPQQDVHVHTTSSEPAKTNIERAPEKTTDAPTPAAQPPSGGFAKHDEGHSDEGGDFER